MYISEFWCGVGFTVLVEFGAIIVAAFIKKK